MHASQTNYQTSLWFTIIKKIVNSGWFLPFLILIAFVRTVIFIGRKLVIVFVVMAGIVIVGCCEKIAAEKPKSKVIKRSGNKNLVSTFKTQMQ